MREFPTDAGVEEFARRVVEAFSPGLAEMLSSHGIDPRDGREKRYHIHESVIQKAVAAALLGIGNRSISRPRSSSYLAIVPSAGQTLSRASFGQK